MQNQKSFRRLWFMQMLSINWAINLAPLLRITNTFFNYIGNWTLHKSQWGGWSHWSPQASKHYNWWPAVIYIYFWGQSENYWTEGDHRLSQSRYTNSKFCHYIFKPSAHAQNKNVKWKRCHVVGCWTRRWVISMATLENVDSYYSAAL